ncbi:MAG TPA: TIGR02757 family protein [Candidatus Polarisedimenticolia bacterium]|nr:TIGR02757 family protein [Candidatus Polarisedimenticolia bacterium]
MLHACTAPHDPSFELKVRLDSLYRKFGGSYLESDPICFPRGFRDPADRETIGFLTTALAYGRVDQIKASVRRLAAILGASPAAFIRRFDARRDRRALRGFAHRFNDARDAGLLLHFMRQMLEQDGSIEAFFLRGFSGEHEDIGAALESFSSRALALDCSPYYPSGRLPARAGVRFFFASPRDGSSCKRLNLFLRWMVRRDDGVDLGVWRGVPASRLVIPLDTHVSRIASYIGLTRRRSVGWKMALEVTGALRRLDPFDPVKYDFALCRLGILDACPRRRDEVKCAGCDLRPVCALP